MITKLKYLFFIAFAMFVLNSCWFYSFTGASIPPEAKTVSIQYFDNRSRLVEPTLSQVLTDKLRDRFANQTSLDLVNRNGDLQLEGEITEYSTMPVALQGGDLQQGQLNRLTIRIQVRFINLFDEANNFDTSFERYEDYASSESLSSVQDALIENIAEALVEDVFNRAVVNW